MSTHSELADPARSKAQTSAPYRRPRDAASLILLDRSGSEIRVLLGKRHTRHVFMPGMLVFPGGSLDNEDRRMRYLGALDPASERRLLAGSPKITPARSHALALTAIRETCEETGLLLGRRTSTAIAAPSAGWAPFAETHIHPDLAALTFVARAITPPGRTRRFDTRFFIADRRDAAHQIAGISGPDAELVELKWLSFAEARAAQTPGITKIILEEVATRLQAGRAARMPVPFFYSRNGKSQRDQLI